MSTWIDPILDGIDATIAWFASATKQNISAYCQLESANSQHRLVTRDGSVVSIIEIHGTRLVVGDEEFAELLKGVMNSMKSAMRREGHGFQWVFQYDPQNIKQALDIVLSPAEMTARALKLDLADLFQEKRSVMKNYCAEEKNYLVVWTSPASLTKQQRKRALQEIRKEMGKAKLPTVRDGQNVISLYEDLHASHDAWVRALQSDFNGANLVCELLDVHKALKAVRQTIEPYISSEQWRPILPGDRIPLRAIKKNNDRDISELFYPTLTQQLFPRDGEVVNLRSVRLGNNLYAPVTIALFPQEVRSFQVLFNRLLNSKVPWRISTLVQADGLPSLRTKALFAAILSFASRYNALIHDATKQLQAVETGSDDAIVSLQMSLVTWAPVDDPNLLEVRVSELIKAVEGWGYCEVSEFSGDSFGGFCSTVPAVMQDSVAVRSVAPLSEVGVMLPFSRPSSPWAQGAVLFRTPDGKIWPFQPGSSMQTTWIDIVYARPGSGKSVLSNALNLGLCCCDTNKRLPYISIIDIGPSSSGLISLLREALPEGMKHQVAYHRLKMQPEHSINVFDTQLGCRSPTPLERAFLVNFVTLLATPISSRTAYDGMADMAGLIVDELYKEFNSGNNPKMYTVGIAPLLDKELEDLQFHFDVSTSWWDAVDFLFTKGKAHDAMLAQRYAVPVLSDAVYICRKPAIMDLYGRIETPTKETLIEAFTRMMSAAVREYPILSQVTAFDIGDARVVSLDLDEVAKTGGEAADRQTAVMYMLARYVLAKHFYLNMDHVNNMPELYRNHHRLRIGEIREDQKRIVMDEFHRTSSSKAVRDQVLVDMREGRKWKVQVALLSQSLDDFDKVMIEFATSIYIMDAGPAQAVRKAVETFGLNHSATEILRTQVTGPRPGGGVFLGQFATKYGNYTQALSCTLGPIELWAFSTTAEDAHVRDTLYAELGPSQARLILAMRYPNGSIASVVEKKINQLRENGLLEEGSASKIVDEILQDLRLYHQRLQKENILGVATKKGS